MIRPLVALFVLALIFAGCATAKRDAQPVTGEATGTDRAAAPALAGSHGKPEVIEEKWPNGNMQRRAEGYRDEEGNFVPDGLTTLYFETGQKKIELSFKEGLEDGVRTAWFPSGELRSQGQYAEGMEDGLWVGFFQGGGKQREWHMVRGRWEGTYTEYHPNGNKRLEVEFVNGLRQGPMVVWDDFGAEIGRTDFVDGVEQP